MNSLLLSGYGISMSVDGGRLHVKDGHDLNKPNLEDYVFKPKFIDFDNIVVYGHSGNISLDAIRWLTKQNVQLTVLNWDGRLLTTILPLESRQSLTKMVQYRAYGDKGHRLDLAKTFIDAKIKTSISVLEWLGERYPEVAEQNAVSKKAISSDWSMLNGAKDIREVMAIEGRIAQTCWDTISTVFDKKLEFDGRVHGKTHRPLGAVDPINALFNYGYSILEAQCWKAINSNGLDTHVGFLHEMAKGKAPLVYDLQEPFRWLVDVAVISALERRIFTKKDFILTENYNIRIRPEGVKKLMAELMSQLTHPVQYRNQNWEWGYVITLKAQELAQYLTGKRKSLDFSEPRPDLQRQDSDAMRRKILDMPYGQWKRMGYSKGTLHYLKKNAGSETPFKVYGKVREKIGTLLPLNLPVEAVEDDPFTIALKGL